MYIYMMYDMYNIITDLERTEKELEFVMPAQRPLAMTMHTRPSLRF